MSSPFSPPAAIARNDSWCRFHQQRLSATPEFPYVSSGFAAFLYFGLIYLLIGIALVLASAKLQEYRIEYSDCVSQNGQSVCIKEFNLSEDLQGPVYMYYEISNFYQNHRRFARSVSVEQLRGVIPSKKSLQKCQPLLSSKNESQEYIYMPCGLLPNSVFNDSFLLKFIESPSSMHSVPLSRSSIAWKSDVEKMYGTVPSNGWTGTIKPPNWPKPAYERAAGAFKTDQELMVWNRIAPFSTFRKLHRILDTRPGIFASGFPAGKYSLQITSNFPVAVFGGTKAVIFAQVNCLGRRNIWLGVIFTVTGLIYFLLGLYTWGRTGKLYRWMSSRGDHAIVRDEMAMKNL
nr:unnamed protein product [Spirometra erinaceieuropaei]